MRRLQKWCKILAGSFCVAFSMYSAIPVPHTKWNKRNMRYAFCFFPFVGAVIGAIGLLWLYFCRFIGFGASAYAAGAVALPALITGGIHMDGFCDVLDAVSSRQPTGRKLEILRDSRVGAFALIGFGIYLLVSFGFHSQLYNMESGWIVIAGSYIISRSLSGLGVLLLPCARPGGLASLFAANADKRHVMIALCIWGTIGAAIMVIAEPVPACFCLFAVFFSAYYCRYKAMKEFNGVTGDVAGWFLQICEAAALIAAVIGGSLF